MVTALEINREADDFECFFIILLSSKYFNGSLLRLQSWPCAKFWHSGFNESVNREYFNINKILNIQKI
jgi:hypothetical protein